MTRLDFVASVALAVLGARAGGALAQTAGDAPEAQPDTAAPAAPAATATAEPAKGWTRSFTASESFRLRATQEPDDSDRENASASDLRLSLDGSVIDPDDRLELQVSLGFWATIHGGPDEDGPIGWSSIHSKSNSPLWLDVYQLYLEYRPGGKLRSVRAGRQEAPLGPLALFDGASLVAQASPKLKLFAFGGRTMHFFEIIDSLFEDWIASAGAEVRVGSNLKLNFDYRLLIEDIDVADSTEKRDVTDHGYGASAWWRKSRNVMARGWVRGVDDQLSSVGGSARLQSDAGTSGAEVRADVQPSTLDELNELDDPYSLVLGESLAHGRLHLDGWKGFGPVALHVGLDGRFLLEGDESQFNRNLGRAYLLASATDLGVKGVFASASVEYHDDLDFDEGLVTAAGAAGFAGKKLRAEAGTAYQRWKYSYYRDLEEIADVRSVWVDARVKVLDWMTVRGRYQVEIFDRTLHTVTLSVTQVY